MKKFLYSLIALWLLSVPAHAVVDRDCDYTQGSTSTNTGFINCAEELAKLYERACIPTSGVSGTNSIVASSSPAVTALVEGLCVYVTPANTISGAATLALDGLTARSVTSNAGTAVGSGDMTSGTRYTLVYNLASTRWEITNALGTGFAAASSTYVVQALTAGLSAERALTAGTAMGLTDGGANSTLTINLTDVELTSLAGLTSAANTIGYWTGSGTAAVADFSAAIRTVITTPSSVNFRAWVSDEVGTGSAMFGLISTMNDDLGCTASQVVRRNVGDTAFECATLSGTGDLLASNNLTDVANVATAFANIKQAATSSATGVVELATPAEVLTGSSTTLAVTPEGAKRSPGQERCVAVSDQTTAITLGNAKVTFPAFSVAWTVTGVYAMVNTTSSSGVPTFDINEDPDREGVTASTTILSTKITIDETERHSVSALTAAVISDTALAANAEMTVDIDDAGNGVKGAVVCLVGHPA